HPARMSDDTVRSRAGQGWSCPLSRWQEPHRNSGVPDQPPIPHPLRHPCAVEVFQYRNQILSRNRNTLPKFCGTERTTPRERAPDGRGRGLEGGRDGVQLGAQRNDLSLALQRLEERPEVGAGPDFGRPFGEERGREAGLREETEQAVPGALLVRREGGTERCERDEAVVGAEGAVGEGGGDDVVGEPWCGAGRERAAELLAVDARAERLAVVVVGDGSLEDLAGLGDAGSGEEPAGCAGEV